MVAFDIIPTTHSDIESMLERRYLTGNAVTLIQKLTASDRAANDEFGVSVAIEGHIIVIGAFKANTQRGKHG